MGGWDIEILYVAGDGSAEGLAAEREGWVVETAATVAEATETYSPAEFDCLVTEYTLPDGDGVELVKRVRASNPELPVVLYAMDGSEAVASNAISAGVTEYVQKREGPEQQDRLRDRISNAVEQYRLQEELARSRQRLSLFVEQSPLGVIEWNHRGHAVRVNGAAEEILGYSETDLLGEHWETVVAESDLPAVRERVNKLPDDETNFRHVSENVTKDSERIVCEWHTQVIADDNGEVITSYSQFQEVTKRQFRREAITDLHDIVDRLAACSSRQGVYEQTIEAAGQILAFDRAAVAVERDGMLRVTALSNELSLEEHPALPADEGIAGECYQHGRASLVDDIAESSEAEPQSADMRAAISVPIGEYGVFQAVETYPEAFDEQDLELAKLLVQHAETALQRLAREQELERVYEQIEFALDVTDSVIWAVDAETREIQTEIGPAKRLFGVSAEQFPAVDTFLSKTLHPAEIDRIRAEAAAVLSGEKTEFDVVYRTTPDDETVRWLEALGYLQADNQRVIGLVTDVTDREQRERELETQNERLEQFTNVVGHDLRNPLQVAGNWLELAREDVDSEYLDNIAQAHERMSVLLEQLLQLARDGDEALDSKAVALGECSERCWQTVDTAEATLVIDVEQTLHADQSRLQQLLENLFRNAVEHGPSNVSVRVGELHDGFYVSDSGPGIPPEDRTAVFETGYSIDSTGTGFGLSIVNEIVEAHDWQIEVTESADGGARFEITGVEFH